MQISLLRPNRARRHTLLSGACVGLACGLSTTTAMGGYLDTIGATQLHNLGITGSGIAVAQPEASDSAFTFEADPTDLRINQPVSIFTYSSTNGGSIVTVTGVAPPNAAGYSSGHALVVGAVFYGSLTGNFHGVAPGIAAVENDDADYFYNHVITTNTPISARVVNMSYSNGVQEAPTDQNYDNYAFAHTNVVFVAAVGPNSGTPTSPATMYNGIAVNIYATGTNSAVMASGPTTDGRSKPDLCAPVPDIDSWNATSYVTPEVSGAAALLLQAGTSSANVPAAQDARTIKALLLNSAVKPAGWSHTATAPLDTQYGAGVLNVYNSYLQLQAGQQSYISSNTTPRGGPYTPPAGVLLDVPSSSGWDFNTISTTSTTDTLNNYFFTLTGSPGSSAFDLSATLTWDRQSGQASINNLYFYLYDVTTSTLVDNSISSVDNVQQLYDLNLAPGRYDLEIIKAGGIPGVTDVSDSETYAMAYSFTGVPEPSSLALFAGAGMMLLMRRRRRRA